MRDAQFTKYQGLGNDFVLIDARDESAVRPEDARAMCDRHFGVGADGVLLVLPGERGAHARMRVLNADGSVPEMCGNGLRCVAEHVGRARGLREVVVATDAGVYTCVRGDADLVTVDMGQIAPSREERLVVAGRELTLHLVDMGNPHAVIFDATLAREAATLGPQIERHAAFPRGINVEFVTDTPASLDVVVWERGVGLTLACGTGACAVARAAVDTSRRPPNAPLLVRLPGGSLTLTVSTTLKMQGPATPVFTGTLSGNGDGP